MEYLRSKEHLFSLFGLNQRIFAHLDQNRGICASAQTNENFFFLDFQFHAQTGLELVFRHFGKTAVAECFVTRF
jgi:hypothetical protein